MNNEASELNLPFNSKITPSRSKQLDPGNFAYNSEMDFRSPEHAREIFEHQYAGCQLGEREVVNEDGTTRTLALYEVGIDVANDADRREHMGNFLLTSALAGYKQASSPVVLPSPHLIHGDKGRPLTYVYFTLEKSPIKAAPSSKSPTPQTRVK